MDNIASLLETKLEEAEKALNDEVRSFLASRQKVLTLRNDVVHLRGSLEALTRNNGHRYIASPVTTEADNLLALIPQNDQKPEKKPTTQITKVGEVFRAIKENPGLKSRQLCEVIEKSGKYAFKITMDDIHRTTFRLLSREKIRRDEKSALWPVTEDP